MCLNNIVTNGAHILTITQRIVSPQTYACALIRFWITSIRTVC